MKTKFLLTAAVCLLVLVSCKKGSSADDASPGQQGIYVQFEAESPIVSYTDNNPDIPSTVNTGIPYGPCKEGSYLFTAKLQNGRQYTQQSYKLASPAPGYHSRIYIIRFYYAADLNRWLYTYQFTDSK